MTPEETEQISQVASDVRRWIVKRSMARARRNSHKNADCDPSLVGDCAIASARLHKLLSKAGFSPRIHVSDDGFGQHVFVSVGETLVDVTATQFGCRDEVVMRPMGKRMRWYWRPVLTVDTVEDLRRYQRDSNWRPEQIVRTAST